MTDITTGEPTKQPEDEGNVMLNMTMEKLLELEDGFEQFINDVFEKGYCNLVDITNPPEVINSKSTVREIIAAYPSADQMICFVQQYKDILQASEDIYVDTEALR